MASWRWCIGQGELAEAAGLYIQSIVRMERYRDKTVQSRLSTVAKAGLGKYGVLIVPGGAVKAEMLAELVTEMRGPISSRSI